MKVEKIHDNKISIFISLIDLKERNIDVSELYPQNSKVQDLFLDILEEAYVQQDFDVDGCQLYVEAKPLPNHGFHISITKLNEEEELEGDYSSGYFISDIGNFFINSANNKINNELIFSFPSIESIKPCMDFLKNYSFSDTRLFNLNEKYTLTLIPSALEKDTFSVLYAYLSEYGEHEYFSIAYLGEHARTIIKNNALENLEQYFKAEL